MAKVALCISGAFRGKYLDIIKSHIESIALPLNADVFIATWDSYHAWPGEGGYGEGWLRNWYDDSIVQLAPPELITSNWEFSKMFPNVFKQIRKIKQEKLEHKQIESLPNVKGCSFIDEKDFNDNFKNKNNSLKMFYLYNEVIDLLIDYENKGQFFYDYIIHIRPDKGYGKLDWHNTLFAIQDNDIVMHANIARNFASDMFSIGKRFAMIRFLSLFKQASLYKNLEFFNLYPFGICSADYGVNHRILYRCITKFLNLNIKPLNGLYQWIRFNPKLIPIQKEIEDDLIILKQNGTFDDDKLKEFRIFFEFLLNTNVFLSAQERIKSHLFYKLGQAMIVNSKSILGYLKMPYTLYSIKKQHNIEQIAYDKIIKDNPNLKLPPLESYPDYQEALKCKNHLSYKLGEALIKANNKGFITGGGGIWLLFEIRRIIKEHKKAKNENR